jgi:hypothetical protein
LGLVVETTRKSSAMECVDGVISNGGGFEKDKKPRRMQESQDLPGRICLRRSTSSNSSEQRIMPAKVVRALEGTHVVETALSSERVAAIIAELNRAIRVIDNAKQFTQNSEIKFTENSKRPSLEEDLGEFTENSESELTVNSEQDSEERRR